MRFSTFICALVVLFMAACTDGNDKKYSIGVSQCSEDDWRLKMNSEMEREAVFNHNINLEIKSANDNNRQQIKDIDYFIDKKVDLLIVSPNEAAAITPAVSKAFDAGIPVVVVDRSVIGGKYTAYIGADNEEIGMMQGEYVAHRLKHKGKIVEIMGLKGSTPAIQRHEGLMKALKKEPEIEVVASIRGNWLEKEAYSGMDSLLKEYGGEIDMVVAQNDPMALGAYKATKNNRTDNNILFVGIDALTTKGCGVELVKDGVLDASLIYPTGGDMVMQTALNILEHKTYKRVQKLSTALVDKSNANIMLLQAYEIETNSGKMMRLKDQVDEYWDKHKMQTTMLYVVGIMAVIFMVLSFIVVKAYLEKKRLNDKLHEQTKELERQRDQQVKLSQELEKSTHAKLAFFTNVSHDFRTPLTLIADPVEEVLMSENLTKHQKTLMQLAHNNIRILLRLINQILDFRKYENGKMAVIMTTVDFKQQLTNWYGLFSNLAKKRHIHLSLDIAEAYDYVTSLDTEKTERIFFNLVGNAFKFTPENGKINIGLKRCELEGKDWVELSIENTGTGISVEQVNHIFERFYQIDVAHHEGSGIGLALVKSFVDIQGGRIRVEGTDRESTIFTVTLPIVKTEQTVDTPSPIITERRIQEELDVSATSDDEEEEGKPEILVIDDNSNIRSLIHHLLHEQYVVLEAANGKQGIKKAVKHLPDLIICDVMMPDIDGLEVCRRLRKEEKTSKIPIMMLTACSLDEQAVTGLECGADSYVTKPFSSQVLMAQIKSLIDNRKLAKTSDRFVGEAENITDIDEMFLNKFNSIVDKNIDNNGLSIESVAEAMGVSRSQLYRRIKAITNYTPIELIRVTRLKKASYILAASDVTVSEVSYMVGFTSPSYFTKCYKDYFGTNPSSKHIDGK